MKAKVYTVSREKAISIAANHNCVAKEVAERYSDSELNGEAYYIVKNAIKKATE